MVSTINKRSVCSAVLLSALSFDLFAAVQRVDFTMTGSGGESATGFITYDDAVVGNGQAISGGGLCGGGADNSIDYEINITGGVVGPATFTKADCASPPAFCNVPDFTLDVNFFSCTSGAITGSGIAANTFQVSNGGTSNLTFQSISAPVPATPSTIAPVPTLGGWSTMLLSGLLGTLLYRRVRRLSVKGEDKEVG